MNNNTAGQDLRFKIRPGKAVDYGLMAARCVVLALGVLVMLGVWGFPGPADGAVEAAIFLLLLILVCAVRKLDEWERAIVLRFGRFYRVKGPGLVFLIPLADRIAKRVDLRIRVTDFSAQETLTGDSVTVTVDALCFWLVWDPQKAALEVEDYEEAVVLSCKTALRSAVSSHDLSTFLEHGSVISRQIQEAVDKKTTHWGITVQFVEITDIQTPEALQDSLARVAAAEREKQGRVLLAEAEVAVAGKLSEAAAVYQGNDAALKLKVLSVLNEGLKTGDALVLVPDGMTGTLSTGNLVALAALAEAKKGTA